MTLSLDNGGCTLPLRLQVGASFEARVDIVLLDDSPADLSGAVADACISPAAGSRRRWVDFSTEIMLPNRVVWRLGAEALFDIKARQAHWWLAIRWPDDWVDMLLSGPVFLRRL